MKAKPILFTLVLSAFFLLCACGQKGPLILPEDAPQHSTTP